MLFVCDGVVAVAAARGCGCSCSMGCWVWSCFPLLFGYILYIWCCCCFIQLMFPMVVVALAH